MYTYMYIHTHMCTSKHGYVHACDLGQGIVALKYLCGANSSLNATQISIGSIANAEKFEKAQCNNG